MQLITQVVPDDFNLFLYGDTHEGAVHFCRSSWNKFIDIVRKPFDGVSKNFVVDHGDCIEAISTDDRRFDIETADPEILLAAKAAGRSSKGSYIDRQIESAINRRKPIFDKIVTLLKGNHEHALWRYTSVSERIADGLEVSYGTYSAVISYVDKDGDLLFKHYATHGRRTIGSVADDPVRQRANMELQLKRYLKNKFGDTLLNSQGHSHKILTAKPRPQLYITTNEGDIGHHYTAARKSRGYIEPNHKWYACSGSFLKQYIVGVDGYSERAGYDPVELGCVVCKVRDRQIVDLVELAFSTTELKKKPTIFEEPWVNG